MWLELNMIKYRTNCNKCRRLRYQDKVKLEINQIENNKLPDSSFLGTIT